MSESEKIFFSYAREDADFALRLAKDLRAAGQNVWLDQLDIPAGARWDRSVESALTECSFLLVVLSPASVASANVMDEVSYAVDEGKRLIPVLHQQCKVPFRLRRFQYLDFTGDYDRALKDTQRELVRRLSVPSQPRVQHAEGSPARPGSGVARPKTRVGKSRSWFKWLVPIALVAGVAALIASGAIELPAFGEREADPRSGAEPVVDPSVDPPVDPPVDPDPQPRPIARFNPSPSSGPAPLEVAFADETQGSANEYRWDFGDGSRSSEPQPVHRYARAGSYNVTLSVEGPGGSSNFERQIIVGHPAPVHNGVYRIHVKANDRFLHEDGLNDQIVSTRYQPDDPFTYFVFEHQSDGSYRIKVQANDRYLHVDGGADLLLSTRYQPDDDFTRFIFERDREGFYRVRVKATGRYWHEDGLGDRLVRETGEVNDDFTRFKLAPVARR